MPEPEGQSIVAASAPDAAIRDATKWLLAAFASLFVVLAAGLQLSQLAGTGPIALAIALVAAAAALAATVWTIVAAARVLTDLGVSLDDLVKREVNAKLERGAAEDPNDELSGEGALADPVLRALATQADLTHAQTMSPVRMRDALREARNMPTQDEAKRSAAVQAAESDIAFLLQAANRMHYAEAFSRLLRVVLTAAVVVPVAIVAFLLATVDQGLPSPAITEPLALQVRVHLPDREALGLGAACTRPLLDAVGIGGTLAEPLVITSPSPGCRSARFLLTADVGTALPVG